MLESLGLDPTHGPLSMRTLRLAPPAVLASIQPLSASIRGRGSLAIDRHEVPQPMKSPPEADSIRHLTPIESATPSEGFEHR
jgi:hypothetical protein